MLAVAFLVAPQAFGGTLAGRSGNGIRSGSGPLGARSGGGLAGLRPGNGSSDARPGAGLRGGLPMNGPLARFRDGSPLPFPRQGRPGRLGGLAGAGGAASAGQNGASGGGGAEPGGNREAGGNGEAGGGSGSGGQNGAGCADVHIIATRASTEQPGAGIIGSLVDAVSSATDQSVSTDATDYPATLIPYASSVADGVEALTGQLTTQAADCPNSKIVLMGYSQGANVISDVLAGGGGRGLGQQTAPVDPAIAEQVSAVILMGDPRHVAGESFQAGTATTDGLFPRGANQSLEGMADRIQSYCDAGDTFCAGGGNIAVHLGYTRKYNAQAEEFVLDKIGG